MLTSHSIVKPDGIFPKIKTKTRDLLWPLLFNRVLHVLTTEFARKRSFNHPNWKGKSQLSPFTDDMISYVEKPKDSKEIELNKFSKVARFDSEFQVQKSDQISTLKNELYF